VMKVLAVKGVEACGNLWAVRYTRLRADGVTQDALILYDTPDAARAKRAELLDILQHHDGVYLGKKAKKKVKTSRRRMAR